MSKTYLHLVQIGPVQSFIAAARRTQDLYVGSRLLSTLAGTGVQAAHHAGAELLFPVFTESGRLPESIPHRFAFLSERDPEQVVKDVEKAIRDHWRDAIAAPVRDWLQRNAGPGEWEKVFDRQVESWLEFYCVAVPYRGEHGACYQQAVVALNARKQARHFPQVDEPGGKCTLTGAQAALLLDWKRLKAAINDREDIILRPNERLGALAVIKRFAQLAGIKLGVDEQRIRAFPSLNDIAGVPEDSEQPAYLAILHMDGDRMGKLLSAQKTKEAHQKLSEALADLAETEIRRIVRKYNSPTSRSALIYAGGDDVLALLPLQSALACAEEIRCTYAEKIGGNMSAGIAITAAHLPLDHGLDEARLAEKHAKEVYDRNAVAVRDSRSSAIRETGAQWTTGIVPLVEDLLGGFKGKWLSGKFGYDLLEAASALEGVDVPLEARIAEMKRLLKRHSEKAPENDRNALAEKLEGWIEEHSNQKDEKHPLTDLAHWVILARFLAKGGQV